MTSAVVKCPFDYVPRIHRAEALVVGRIDAAMGRNTLGGPDMVDCLTAGGGDLYESNGL
ncbi:MAG: hypothetical protein ACTH0G_09300 [Corynebacterium variabile]